jgi:invasion protein IalB
MEGNLSGPARRDLCRCQRGSQKKGTDEIIRCHDIYETAETEQFSLVFRAPLGVKLPKGMYSIRHRQVGKTALYLQPSGADEFNRYYEASPFNLLP